MKNIIFVVTLLMVGAFALPASVNASSDAELDGFAWASTIGWISMNCSNPIPSFPNGTCASDDGYDYSVVIDTDTNLVTGHAWSPNVGWIQFGGLSSFPTVGTATVNDDVKVVGTVSMTSNFSFTGWARACAATDNGDCSSMTTDVNAGGWDGWISMSGSYGAGSYGVVFQNGTATEDSFAWGGPITMGWIDFSPEGIVPDLGVGLKEIPDIVIEAVGFNPGTIQPDGTYDTVTFDPIVTGIPDTREVDWDLYLIVGGVETLVADGVITQNGSNTDYSPSVFLTNVPAGLSQTLRFEVDMPVADSQVVEMDEVNQYEFALSIPYPPPVITFDGPDVVRIGDRVTVTVTVDAPYDVTCSFVGPGVNSSVVVSGVAGTGSATEQSTALQNSARFEVSCTAGSDVYTEVYRVEVIPTFQEI